MSGSRVHSCPMSERRQDSLQPEIELDLFGDSYG
jgi:hypothetical protein